MADISIKEQKLAAARKKLKRYQKKRADILSKSSRSEESSPLEFLTANKSGSSSRSSSVADFSENGCYPSDLNSVTDSLDAKVELNKELLSTSKFSESNENITHEPLPENLDSSKKIISHYNQVPCELNTNVETVANNNENIGIIDNHNNVNLCHKKENSASNNFLNLVEQGVDVLETEGSICSETDASLTTVIQRKNDGSSICASQDTSLKSTTESLRQLSLQISGLVNDEDIHTPNRQELTILELEKRNNELASLLESEKQKSVEYSSLIDELKRTIDSQKVQIEGFQKMSITDSSSGTEINGLKEQLQIHIQTIGILVAEKSELQTSIAHTRYALEQKSGEVTDLQGRLEASREHVKGLEMSNQEFKNQILKLNDNKESDAQQILSLQTNNSKLSKLCDDMRATTAELTERLAVRTEENQKLNTEVSDIRRELEMAQVHIQQLKNNTTEDLRKQYEELQASYTESLNQIDMMKASIEQRQKERVQLEQEYKNYASQLAADVEDIKGKLDNEVKKCEVLQNKNEELETELKSKENDGQLGPLVESLQREKEEWQKQISELNQIKVQLEEKCSSLVKDNGQLSQYLSELSAKYEALENAVDRNNTYQVDTNQLLQSMQSDKIAASRALSQNKQLKEQLEELQNGFVMMSNKKLELTEKLEKELHIKKGLYKEIAQLNEELSTHKQNLLLKQRELETVKSTTYSPAPQMTAGERVSVNGAYDSNNDNRNFDHHHHYHDENHDCSRHNGGEHHNETTSLIGGQNDKQMENENKTDVTSKDLKNKETITIPNIDENNLRSKKGSVVEDINQDQVSLHSAHEALEAKFMKCMEKLATVSDEKQELEHLVQQLQIETDTIGDYITIYQFQRGVMKQQMQELKFELDLLKTEKQDISVKLSQLQKLIGGLDGNKNVTTGLIQGVNSIINTSDTSKNETEISELCDASDNRLPDLQNQTFSENQNHQEKRKNETVKQIIELLNEMESSNQLDVSAFNKIHPCPHCSGKLITV